MRMSFIVRPPFEIRCLIPKRFKVSAVLNLPNLANLAKWLLLACLSVLAGIEGHCAEGLVHPGTSLTERGMWEDAKSLLSIKQPPCIKLESLRARLQLHNAPADRLKIALALVRTWDNRGLTKPEVVSMMAAADSWEIGWWWIRVGRLPEAIALADELGRANTNGASAEAAQLLSLAHVAHREWTEVLRQADAALRLYDAFDYSRIGGERRERLERHRQEVYRSRDLNLHGIGYVLLCDANRLRLAGELESARSLYQNLITQATRNAGREFIPILELEDPALADQPIAPVFSDAASVFRLACTLGDRRSIKSAEDAVRVVANGPGPLAPVAALALAEHSFNSGCDASECIRLFDAALALAEKSVDVSPAFALPEITFRAVKVEGPMRPVSSWAQADWFKEEAERLYAPAYCVWFSEYLNIRGHQGRAVACFVTGDIKAALADVQSTAQMDPADYKLYQDGMPSNYGRLKDGFQRGRFYATREELSQFKGIALRRLLLTEIYMETERWSDAVRGYDALRADPSSGLTQGARAYLDYAKASALIFQGKTKPASESLSGFEGAQALYRNTPSYWRAIFARVSILPPESAPAALAAALEQDPPKDVHLDLLMNLGQTTFGLGRNAEASKWLKAVIETEPIGWRAVAAQTLLEKIVSGGISADRKK